uniref:Uncharacterized protein n=1 Tax=Romanomermis culicivorax TaxID=13658 RepID=A0A915HJS9_ROMCU
MVIITDITHMYNITRQTIPYKTLSCVKTKFKFIDKIKIVKTTTTRKTAEKLFMKYNLGAVDFKSNVSEYQNVKIMQNRGFLMNEKKFLRKQIFSRPLYIYNE